MVGRYEWKGIYGVGASMDLSDDSTFVYNWVQGLSRGMTKGSWSLQNNSVVLTSDKQEDLTTPNFEVQADSSQSDFFVFSFNDKEGLPIPFTKCLFKLGDDTTKIEVGDFSGVVKVPQFTCDSLICRSPGYELVRYAIPKNLNVFNFQVEVKEMYYRFFPDEKWVIRSGKLYDPQIDFRSKYSKRYFSKVGKK